MSARQKLTLELFQKSDFLSIENTSYKKSVYGLFSWFLTEDKITKDKTSTIIPNLNIKANIISKDNITVAGMEEVRNFFGKNIIFDVKIPDGKIARKQETIAILSGKSNIILSLERTILNILQRMSGIATKTNFFVEKVKCAPIAATRKTPWNLLDKKAVAVGGGITHRLTLSDGILIKDNHLEIIKKEYKLITEEQAVNKILEIINSNQKDYNNIEIEVNTSEGATAAIELFCKLNISNYLTVMFDNWQPVAVKKFISDVKIPKDLINKILFEASGNITEENITEWGNTSVDFISMGSLTHSVKAADLSMEIL